jgi:hypothetical protein
VAAVIVGLVVEDAVVVVLFACLHPPADIIDSKNKSINMLKIYFALIFISLLFSFSGVNFDGNFHQ